MKKITGFGGLAFGGVALFSEGNIAIITAIISFIVMVIWGTTMLLSYINNRNSQKEKDKLNKEEQKAEIAKHKAEQELFEAKLKEINNEKQKSVNNTSR